MSDITIEFHSCLSESPAWALVDAYVTEIIEAGLTQSGTKPDVSGNSWVSCAMHEGECIGFLEVRPYPEINALWISSAYVRPDHRRKGIHDMLFRDAIRQAKLEGFSSVQGGVHVNNKASIASVKKQGRKVIGYFYSYEIKDGD